MRQHGQDKGKKDTGQVLQWQLCEDEAEWQLSQQQTTTDTVRPTSQRSWRQQWLRRWYVLLGVTLFGIVGGVLWYQAQLGVAKIESELQSAIDAEAWLPIEQQTINFNNDGDWQPQLEHEAEQLHKLVETGELVTTMEMLELGQEWAVVQVVIQTTDGTEYYRQMRFYRKTDKGWLRTEPDITLWPPSRRLETEYFIFEYHQIDAQAVAEVAAEVDTLYTTLLTDYGLPFDVAGQKLRVEVSVTQPPGTSPVWMKLNDPFLLSSPALYLAPDSLTDANLLMQALALRLTMYVALQGQWHYSIPEEWPPLTGALRLWQLWELELPLSDWRDEAVRWVYGDIIGLQNDKLYRPASAESIIPPEHYLALCAAHHLWMESPEEIAIPLECDNSESLELELTRWKPLGASLSQHSLGWSIPPSDTYITQMDEIYGKEHPGKAVALAILFEYAAVTYGRDKVPALIEGFGRYEGWEALLPAVLGVSAADFEAGWRSYLAQRYNVYPEH